MTELLAVVAITLFAVISPGPDFAMVSRNSLLLSRRTGVLTALGIAAGVCVHVTYTLLGVGLLIQQSLWLFNLIKLAGAAYLIFLGIKMLRAKPAADEESICQPALSSLGALRTGFLTNVLNPKVALFFLAFFPQFIVATQVDNAAAYLLLGVVYAMISAVWLVALAMLAGTVLSKLLTSQKAKRYMDIGSGAVFVLMGAKVAVSD